MRGVAGEYMPPGYPGVINAFANDGEARAVALVEIARARNVAQARVGVRR